MADLTPRDDARRLNTPPLQGRGRGWGLSAGRLDKLGEHARDMRREPTEPEKRLWRALSGSQLGYKFRRQAVIGPFIADFLCPQKALIVEVDGDTHDIGTDRRRDAALGALGFAVMHVTNADVMRNLDGVCAAVRSALEQATDRWDRPHPNPSPEGEGLYDGDQQNSREDSLIGGRRVTIEEKVVLAISDLEGLLADGADVSSAVAEVALSHQIAENVVRIRGERGLGPLDLVKARSDASKAAAKRRLKLKGIADHFYSDESAKARKTSGAIVSVDDWTRAQMGCALTDNELTFVREIVQRDVARSLLRELDEMPE